MTYTLRSRILVKIGLVYFIVMGGILFLLQFVFPSIYPNLTPYVTAVNDIVIFIMTPLLVMFVLNKEIVKLTTYPPNSKEKIRDIIQDLEDLSLNYGQEAFQEKKKRIRGKILGLHHN